MGPDSTDFPQDLLSERVERIETELARLRKTLLRHGHAQEHFQQQVGRKMDRLLASTSAESSQLDRRQLRALLEFDQSVSRLLDLARGEQESSPASDDAPASLREGLDFLQIRLRNLQRSLGLEPIPALGQPFDDRLHRVEATSCRTDLADGVITEELLPGYLLDGEVARPALVVVHRRPEPTTTTSEEPS